MCEFTARHRVLVVEDDDNIAIALAHVIAGAGISQYRLANGREAWAYIRAAPPELVVLDVMLPEMSGYEICANMRADPRLAQVKSLLMTAGGSRSVRQYSLSIGADGFIAKPFALGDFRCAMTRLLCDIAR